MTRPKPATLASMLHSFFIEYLPRQRALSPHTLRSYRDSIKLLLQFLAERHGGITKLTVEDRRRRPVERDRRKAGGLGDRRASRFPVPSRAARSRFRLTAHSGCSQRLRPAPCGQMVT
jgi:site-specific recombinase XerC